MIDTAKIGAAMRACFLRAGASVFAAALLFAGLGISTGPSRAEEPKLGLVDTDFIFGLGPGAIVKIDKHRWCRIVKREYLCFAVLPRKDWPSSDEIAASLRKHGLSAEGLSPHKPE